MSRGVQNSARHLLLGNHCGAHSCGPSGPFSARGPVIRDTPAKKKQCRSASTPGCRRDTNSSKCNLREDDKSHQETRWEAGDEKFQRPGSLSQECSVQGAPPPGKNELHPLLSLWILLFKVQDPAWEASHPFVRRGPGTRCHSDQPCLWEEVRKNRRKGALAEEVDTEGSKEKVGVRSTCRCPICPDPQAKEGKTFVGQLMGVISHNVWSLALPQCFPSGKREERPLAGKTVPLAELAAASCGSIAVRQR